MLSFADVDVTVITPIATVDARRNESLDYDSPSAGRVLVEGCIRLPGASPEVFGGRDTTGVVWTLLLPIWAAIGRFSAVEMGGTRYQVDGEPLSWSSPTGAVDHIAAALRRFT